MRATLPAPSPLARACVTCGSDFVPQGRGRPAKSCQPCRFVAPDPGDLLGDPGGMFAAIRAMLREP